MVGFEELQEIVSRVCEAKTDVELEHFCSQLWLILGSYRV